MALKLHFNAARDGAGLHVAKTVQPILHCKFDLAVAEKDRNFPKLHNY